MRDITTLRSMSDPPDEAYEATWRDAQKLLEDAGPKAGFILIIATDEGERYETSSCISTGAARIPLDVLIDMNRDWLVHHVTGGEGL